MNDYYVYVLFRHDGRPFYIGKGRGKRLNDHEIEARLGRLRRGGNRAKLGILRACIEAGREVPAIKLAQNLTNEKACEYEIAWIAALGRMPHGPLVNLTDGGEGASNPSAETRAKKGAALRGKPLSAEHRTKLSETLRSRPPEVRAAHRAKLSAAARNRSPEVRMKMGHRRGKKSSAETRAKIAAAITGQKRTPEMRANMRMAWERRRGTSEP